MNSSTFTNSLADIFFIPKRNKNKALKNEIKVEFMKHKAQNIILKNKEIILPFSQGQNKENDSKKIDEFPGLKYNFFDELEDSVETKEFSSKKNEAYVFKSHLF